MSKGRESIQNKGLQQDHRAANLGLKARSWKDRPLGEAFCLGTRLRRVAGKKIQIFQPSFLIRQQDLLRINEKIGIKIFSVLNKFGLFKSLKPITVNFLANRMIQEVLSTNNNILTYKLDDILVH